MDLPPEHSTSTIFHRAFALNGTPPDTSLVSSDAIYFHVHRQQLLAFSTNAFGGLLTQHTPALSLPESSAALNVVLHTIYGMSCVHTGPPLEDTESAVGALVKYGLPVAHLTGPGMPLYQLLLSYAPYRPIEAYALAGHFRLDALAAAVSSHLLAFDVSTLSDALAVKMGPVYFRRLYDLHRSRLAALRTIVLRPPARHALTPGCNEEVQQEVSRAWAFASAEIVWNARPSESAASRRAAGTVHGALMRPPSHLSCAPVLRHLDVRAPVRVRAGGAGNRVPGLQGDGQHSDPGGHERVVGSQEDDLMLSIMEDSCVYLALWCPDRCKCSQTISEFRRPFAGQERLLCSVGLMFCRNEGCWA